MRDEILLVRMRGSSIQRFDTANVWRELPWFRRCACVSLWYTRRTLTEDVRLRKHFQFPFAYYTRPTRQRPVPASR
jgi:hypothetical protein